MHKPQTMFVRGLRCQSLLLVLREGRLMGDKRLQPPLPRAEPRIRVLHEDVTTDRYRWLRDPENPDSARIWKPRTAMRNKQQNI